MSTILQDLRFAVRQLRRSPGFALTGVLTLALAIGAACVMFAVVRSVLLEPLPYPEANRLVGVARAVIHKPALLLADEPTGNLHSAQAAEVMRMFRALNEEGTTVVQVTHSESNAAYGTRVIELRDGWLTWDTAQAAAAASVGR